jgi:hypothetical protein
METCEHVVSTKIGISRGKSSASATRLTTTVACIHHDGSRRTYLPIIHADHVPTKECVSYGDYSETSRPQSRCCHTQPPAALRQHKPSRDASSVQPRPSSQETRTHLSRDDTRSSRDSSSENDSNRE